ncbi:MAG: PilN domain-containing protein [Phycisphaerae bacterium]|nr:PilN domain-containing protein [Phycisphaerae bacterium]
MIDFLPNRIRQQRKRRRLLIRQGIWVGICAMGLLLYAHVRQNHIHAAQAELTDMVAYNQGLQEQMAARDALEKQQQELEIARKVEAQLGSRVNALDVLAELGDKMPANMALKSLTFETVEQRVPVEMVGRAKAARASVATATREKSVKRVRLTITALSTSDVDIANFIAQLSVSPLFEDVNMGYAKTVSYREKMVREFQSVCYVSK